MERLPARRRQPQEPPAVEVPEGSDAAVAAVFREEAGRLTAALVRILGDFESAEELVQEALLVALERWRHDGIPAQPRAWLSPPPGGWQSTSGGGGPGTRRS
jgi:hypothetical protein